MVSLGKILATVRNNDPAWHALGNYAAVQALMTQSGGNTLITFSVDNVLTLPGVNKDLLSQGDFLL